jgi:predicted DNA-binding protein YlxM (UPF0122 family)
MTKMFIKKKQLKYLYENEELSMREIGERFGMTPSGIQQRMIKYGIKRRDGKQATGLSAARKKERELISKLYRKATNQNEQKRR